MTDKKSDDPSATSAEYDIMAPRWALMNALLGGTETMRAAAETYLPRHERETDVGYDDRLASVVLLNQVERTLETLVGKPFSVPVTPSEDIPATVKPWLDDVDLKGNNVDVFARAWFREGLAKAFCHVLVDMPRRDATVQTKADERAANLRPYWVLIKPENLIAAREVVVNGVSILTHARIAETYDEIDGFATVTKNRIRVLEPGMVALYNEVTEAGQTRWQLFDSWTTDLNFVPLVTFYSSKDGFMLGKPRLLDLAELNKAHWQSSSDQRHILTVARFPILACSGQAPPVKEGNNQSRDVEVGPDVVLYNDDPQSRYYYVEHTGKAIEAGRNDLKDLEEQMASYGAQFLKERPGTQTATGKAIETAEATSELATMVRMFMDSLAVALYYTGLWAQVGNVPTGTIEVSTEWSPTDDTAAANLKELRAMRDKKEISRVAYLTEAKSYGVLPDDYDPVKDADQLLAEAFVNMTPQERDQLLKEEQGDVLAWSELRAILRKAGIATLDDVKAKDEIDSAMDFVQPMPVPNQPPPPPNQNPLPPPDNQG